MAAQDIVFRFRSREYTQDDLASIRRVIANHFDHGRVHISRLLATSWDWRQPNGKIKDFAVRDTLLRMEEAGLITLPAPKTRNDNRAKKPLWAPLFDRPPIEGAITDYPGLRVCKATGWSKTIWRYLLARYHYLGCPKVVGAHLCQMAMLGERIVGCLAWGSAAWKIGPRDHFIGWDEKTKRDNLHLVVSNVRFLVPPWVRIQCLASKILSLCLKDLSAQWERSYGHPVYLAETFVDVSRFQGTTYKAANWIHLGQTKGSAKRGNSYHFHGAPKAIFVYPLHSRFRRRLAA